MDGHDPAKAGRDRTVLMVAAEFPPVKTIGRIRTVKFINHLRRHGWRAIVLTVAPNGTTVVADPALEGEVPPDTPVHRLPMPDIEAAVVRAAKRVLRPGTGPGSSAGGAAPASPASARPIRRSPLDSLHKAFATVLRDTVHVPDPYILWARHAAREALRVVESHPVDVVYTTLPPFSAALVGHAVKARTGLPWVVDYRDLWAGDVLRAWVPRWRQRVELWLERHWIGKADAVIAVSAEKTAFLRRLHRDRPIRWETITNGYDLEEFAGLERPPREEDGTIRFVFTGRLFKNRRGHAFAEALGALRAERPDLAARARVLFYGGVSPEIRAEYDRIIDRHGLDGQFHFLGDVPHAEAKAAQVNADYLLLIVDTGDTSDGVIPGKLFEYVGAARPIFALCDPGATATIIRNGRLGQVVAATDAEACKNALREVLARPVPRRLEADDAYLAQFDRRLLAARLAHLLDQLAEPAGTEALSAIPARS